MGKIAKRFVADSFSTTKEVVLVYRDDVFTKDTAMQFLNGIGFDCEETWLRYAKMKRKSSVTKLFDDKGINYELIRTGFIDGTDEFKITFLFDVDSRQSWKLFEVKNGVTQFSVEVTLSEGYFKTASTKELRKNYLHLWSSLPYKLVPTFLCALLQSKRPVSSCFKRSSLETEGLNNVVYPQLLSPLTESEEPDSLLVSELFDVLMGSKTLARNILKGEHCSRFNFYFKKGLYIRFGMTTLFKARTGGNLFVWLPTAKVWKEFKVPQQFLEKEWASSPLGMFNFHYRLWDYFRTVSPFEPPSFMTINKQLESIFEPDL